MKAAVRFYAIGQRNRARGVLMTADNSIPEKLLHWYSSGFWGMTGPKRKKPSRKGSGGAACP